MDVQIEIDALEENEEEKEAQKVEQMMTKLRQQADPRVIIRKKLEKIKGKIRSIQDDTDWGNRDDMPVFE